MPNILSTCKACRSDAPVAILEAIGTSSASYKKSQLMLAFLIRTDYFNAASAAS